MSLPQVDKPLAYRDLGPVEINQLMVMVARLSDQVWTSEDQRKENDFTVFHHTRHLIFRFTPGNRSPRDFYSNPAWDIWAPVLLPVLQQAMTPYGFARPEFPKAMLARLEAGQVIDRHRGGAGSNLASHKIHVPLVTNPEALFESGGIVRHLERGHAYEVNNVGLHSARNLGSEDRIHLIFEVFDAVDADRLAEGRS